MERRVIAIVGPTASGKSEIAFRLAKVLDTEVISADSRQIYKELKLGTVKPPENYLNEIKHYFIDHISISEKYDVGKYVKEAKNVIENLHQRNKIPIIVGGTGLYINALLYGLFEGPSASEEIRYKLEKDFKERGIDFLLYKLKDVDPITYEKIDKNNPRRIIRALEVYYLKGIPISSLHVKTVKPEYEKYVFGLKWDRKILYERINMRVEMIIESGLIDEVKNLVKIFGRDNQIIIETVGYKEILGFLEGKLTFNETIELIKRNTRRYAKRQMTWFRKNKEIVWLEITSNSEMDSVIQKILQTISEGKSYENKNKNSLGAGFLG